MAGLVGERGSTKENGYRRRRTSGQDVREKKIQGWRVREGEREERRAEEEEDSPSMITWEAKRKKEGKEFGLKKRESEEAQSRVSLYGHVPQILSFVLPYCTAPHDFLFCGLGYRQVPTCPR